MSFPVILFATYLLGSMSIFASAIRMSSMVLWTGQTDFTYVSAIIPVSNSIPRHFKHPFLSS